MKTSTIGLLLCFTAILVVSSCSQRCKDKPIMMKLISEDNSKGKPEAYQIIDPKDSLLTTVDFNWEGTEHSLKAFTSDYHADIDGGLFYLTLDSLGVIYCKSTAWPGSVIRLYTDNDSVNNLLIHALAIALSTKRIRNYPYEPPPAPRPPF
jgi:hypothetical protein